VSKASLTDLALFGGAPMFDHLLHVGAPNIGDREKLFARLGEILDRRWLTNNGPMVRDFERRIADYVGVQHCVAMCNATIALEIAVRALGMSGEVIVPSMTFVATAHALQWQKTTPVFCDIRPHDYTLDPELVESMITPSTTGIIGVHLWGHSCDVEAIAEIAARHKLRLIFDAAHAFGVSRGGQRVGRFGDAEVLSFHATKFLNSFEGGAVVTNDEALAEKIRLMKNFGFSGRDNVVTIGTNGKMTEISAAMGLTSLDAIGEFIAWNRLNYDRYRAGLAGIPGVTLRGYPEGEQNNFQYIVIELDPAVAHLRRDTLIRVLHAENVLARRYFYPGCHRMEPYRSYFPHAHFMLPVTERVLERVVTLPTGTAVPPETVDDICSLIRLAVSMAGDIERRTASEPSLAPTGTDA
jgi:dTDP-4-amino-4,6-dideoxygalactose transaminase